MKNPVGAGLLILVAVFAGGIGIGVVGRPTAGNDASHAQDITYAVTSIVDGDTIKIIYNGRSQSVRLLRIDTPEREEPGYYPAASALSAFIGDAKKVTLEFERSEKPERDRYERPLVYIYAGGKNCNVEMVRQGWSRFWTKYGEGRLAGEFEIAEQEARAGKRGLWANGGEPPHK